MISEIYSQFPIYGYRRIHAILNKKGITVNHKKVQKLMKLLNLQAIYPKPNTSKKDKQSLVHPYLLSDLNITKPNQVWQTDMYLRTNHGFMYFVSIIDVYSRKIMGHRLSNSLDTESCILALQDAISAYGVPEIVNSDQGSQFTSQPWISLLQAYNIKISMTGKGRCCDNIYIERLWRSFKYEGSYLYKWNTVSDLKSNIPWWINWYNGKRPHQSLDYETPDDYYNNGKMLSPKICSTKSAATWPDGGLFADLAQLPTNC